MYFWMFLLLHSCLFHFFIVILYAIFTDRHMMNKNYIYRLGIILLLFCGRATLVWSSFATEHIGAGDGLSHYSINEFYEDEFGRMWVGTRHGLNCVVGSSCRIVGTDIEGNGLPNFYVRHICGDRQGSMFIQSGSNAVWMNLQTEEMIIADADGVQDITYGNHRYLYAARDSVFEYHPASRTSSFVFSPHARILALLETERELWVTTEQYILAVQAEGTLPDTICMPRASYIYSDTLANAMWFCSSTDGLMCWQDHTETRYLPSQDVRTVLRARNGEIWVGTWSGLVRINTRTQQVEKVQFSTSSEMHPFSIWALTSDRQGTLWIGSFFGGIDLYNPQHDLFRFWTEGDAPYGLTHPIVSCVSVTDDAIWVGTNGGGICCIQSDCGHVHAIPIDEHIPQCAIKALWIDSLRQTLWIGTHGKGLLAMDMLSEQITSYSTATGHLANDRVRDLVYYRDTLYFSTEKGIGWVALDHRSFGQLSHIDISGELSDLHCVGDCLWFARLKTGYCYHFPTARLERIPCPHSIQCLSSDQQGILYAGTTHGVYRYDAEAQAWSIDADRTAALGTRLCTNLLTTDDYSIVGGIGDITLLVHDDNIVYHFNYADKFPIEIPTEKSALLTSDRTLYIGGINGLCALRIPDVLASQSSCSIIPYMLSVRNSAGDLTTIEKGLPYIRTLTLQPDERDIRIRFTTTDHCTVIHSTLRYRLRDYEKKWQTMTDGEEEVHYADLHPGKYIFEVQDDCGDSWEMAIVVLTPWYQSWWAKLMYVLLLVLIIVSSAIYAHRRATRKAKVHIDAQKRMLDQQNEQIQRMREHLENERISFSTRARAIIMQNLNNPKLDVNMLAQEMCVSRSGIYTKLQEAIGQTPNDLIMSIRLEESARMLRENPDRSITEISEMIGFNSTSYFIKCFSRQFNQTPNQYRKQPH